MGIGQLAGGWVVYFFLHSLLATTAVKQWAERVWGSACRFYRLGYNILSTAGLIVLMWWNGSIDSPYYVEPEGLLRYTSFMFTVAGVMVIQIAFQQYRLKNFLGFGPETAGLQRHGVLGWVRHPIYSGIILVTFGLLMFVPNLPTLVTCVCIFAYLPIGIWLEERKLVKEYGQQYLDYCKDVPALIPSLRRLMTP